MHAFATIALLVFLAALFGYLNARFLRLAPTIGLMLLALIVSMILIGLHVLGLPVVDPIGDFLADLDFHNVLFNGVLGYLLFAGALGLSVEHLAKVRWQVFSLSTVGVIGSTVIVGFALYGILQALGLGLSLIYCLLFGALISPTDPVAVLPIIRRTRASRSMEALISGESLFNDGFAVVVFVVLLSIATRDQSGRIALHAVELFFREAVGGLAFGLALGWIGYRIIKTIDDYPIEILITLALVGAGYYGAQALGISGPLAMVVAGIVIGNYGRVHGMSAKTSQHLESFWELVDIILNAILFMLIGLEVLVFEDTFSPLVLMAGLIAIPVVLVARLLSVGGPMRLFRLAETRSRRAIPVVTWAGLRGAIPVALALSLPPDRGRGLVIAITYVVVVFSILVQGTTIQHVIGGGRQADRQEGR